MIQRIQTVWLFMLVIISIIWTIFPQTDEVAAFVQKGGSAIVAIAALVAIFLYKNRKIQLQVCYGILAVWIVVSVTLFIRGLAIPYGILYFCCLLTDIMAILAIRKDEKLVRSLDRLR